MTMADVENVETSGKVLKTENGQVQEYQGEKLNPPIDYSYEFSIYETLGDAQQSEDWPSPQEILKFVNAKAKTAAKASAYQAATKALKEAYEATPEFKRATIAKSLVAAGMDPAEAEKVAAKFI